MVTFKLPSLIIKSTISSPMPSPTTTSPELQTIPLWLTPALDYISRRLQDKFIHLTLILFNTSPLTSHPSNDTIRIIPASPLCARSQRILKATLTKAIRKHSMPPSWLSSLLPANPEPISQPQSYLIHRSLLQNEVLYSAEGLTLLSTDHVHTFKTHLSSLSSSQNHHGTPLTLDARLETCVSLLRRITNLYSGRPLTKGYLMRAYDHMHMDESLLGHVNTLYETRYGTTAVIMGSKVSSSPKPDPKQTFPRFAATVGPKTPVTAADVTPITRQEWNHILIGLQC